MSDPNDWQAPGGSWTPPPSGQGDAAPAYGTGWTPPPKPGLIPLRPLSLGTILGGSFQVLRRNPRPTFGLSLVLNLAILLLIGIVIGSFALFAFGRISSASSADEDDIIAGSVLAGGITLLAPIAASLAVATFLQGIIALEVARGTLGEKLNSSGLFRLARGRIGALIGWGFLVTAAWLIAVLLGGTVVALLIAYGGTAGLVIGILFAVLIGLVLIAAAVWIGTKVALVPSILMLERLPLRDAIARSWRLTDRAFWRTFGIILLVQVIVSTAAQVITLPLSFIFGILTVLIAPTGEESSTDAFFVVSQVVIGVVSTVIGSVTTVMVSATSALLYIDLRMRKEGLDLDLQQFVEARAAGNRSVSDPYLVERQTTPVSPIVDS